MYLLLLKGVALGLVAGAIPGPILTATFTQVINKGLNQAMKLVWWSLSAEIAAASFIMILVSFFPIQPRYFQLVSFVGAIVIFKMAVAVWKIKSVAATDSLVLTVKDIYFLTFSNGLLWTFWITVCVPFAISLETDIPYGRFVYVLLFEIGWLVSTGGFAILFSLFKSHIIKSTALPFVFKAFALLLFYFAVDMLASAAKALNEILRIFN